MNSLNKNNDFDSSRPVRKIFVYGTLRENYGHKLYNLLKNNFDLLGKGIVKGDLFDIGRYPGAVFSKTNNKIVGEIYQAKDNSQIDSALKILDKYEGFDKTDLNSSEYIRKRKLVRLDNGKQVLSWVYIYNKPIKNKRLIAGGDYIRDRAKRKRQ